MNKVIYDIRKDKHLKELILEQDKCFDTPFYKPEYGVYGSSEWFDNVLKVQDVAKSTECTVIDLKKGGKATLDMISLLIDGDQLDFIAKGDFSAYKIGQKLKVIICVSDKIFSTSTSGWELIYCELS